MLCSRDDPTRQCVERREAVRRGEFTFAPNASYVGAWIWKGAKTNPWSRCPFCDGELPTMADAVRRILDGTCWDGEDE